MESKRTYEVTFGYLLDDKLIEHVVYGVHTIRYTGKNGVDTLPISEYLEQYSSVNGIQDVFGDETHFKVGRGRVGSVRFDKEN